ncbi:MAG: hypothetical protein ACM3VS_07140 [Candidatus Dadabacteria bacterium]
MILPDICLFMADVDIISDILSAAVAAYPNSDFIQGISHRYLVHGGLSKKQLEGLYQKAIQIKGLSPGKLATLEAVILKRPTRYRSQLPETKPLYSKDEKAGQIIREILEKYPQHKRVLYLQTKYNNNEPLTPAEVTELEKFSKLLLKK